MTGLSYDTVVGESILGMLSAGERPMVKRIFPQLTDEFRHFNENRSRYPAEKLLPSAGQHLAWSLDGKQIIASAEDDDALELRLAELGISPDQVVFDYIDPPDLVRIG